MVLARDYKGILVGLCGYAGVGKNTIADLLPYPQAAFANALKDDICSLLKLSRGDLELRKPEFRDLLVAYGAAARKIDSGFWINRLTVPDEGAPITIVSDTRYVNETNFIFAHRGIVIRIKRDGICAANEEESRSIEAVEAAYPAMTVVKNPTDNPKYAAEYLRGIIGAARR